MTAQPTDRSEALGDGSDRAALEVVDLHKRYRKTPALNGISLALEHGELLAVVGPSGCGKSTLLRAIAGLTPPDSGRVVLDGQLVDDGSHRIPPERRGVGLVFQDHALFPHLTVRDNVGFGLGRSSGAEARSRVTDMLDLVGLGAHGDRFPHELSGGERQRVALARALAPKPALMLFDEPFASIDHNLRARLRADVVNALRSTGTASLFVTHDQSEALAIGDRIAVLRGGRVEQLDGPEAIFHRPANAFVGAFMGDASFLVTEQVADGLRSALGPVAGDDGAALSGPVRAMVRPDDVHFEPDGDGSAEVVAAQYRGSGWLLTVELDDGQSVLAAASHLLAKPVGQRGRLSLVEGHRQFAVAAAES
jgi:iron(III) transport system ATP-binding protein